MLLALMGTSDWTGSALVIHVRYSVLDLGFGGPESDLLTGALGT